MLTAQQIICLKYIDHLDQPLSQGEAERILESFVERLPSQYEAVLVGESRRGVSKISTVSIMLYIPTTSTFPCPPTRRPHRSPPPLPHPRPQPLNTPWTPPLPHPSSSSPSDATPASTPLKKRKNVLKKSERTSSLTKAARSSSVLHRRRLSKWVCCSMNMGCGDGIQTIGHRPRPLPVQKLGVQNTRWKHQQDSGAL
ncbi:hypothetical protein DFP72DRAFT_301713 [Ephemerocybe angulata]|uniref:Uncharacterized protein n=1 Tax=Ephemerocybe angulata TaxID=980116 RepID=A0A8H6I1R5_9AGAR|nr:hypothetical protein DFP72DRAFT_301713 [Tulosesus angulatus]